MLGRAPMGRGPLEGPRPGPPLGIGRRTPGGGGMGRPEGLMGRPGGGGMGRPVLGLTGGRCPPSPPVVRGVGRIVVGIRRDAARGSRLWWRDARAHDLGANGRGLGDGSSRSRDRCRGRLRSGDLSCRRSGDGCLGSGGRCARHASGPCGGRGRSLGRGGAGLRRLGGLRGFFGVSGYLAT